MWKKSPQSIQITRDITKKQHVEKDANRTLNFFKGIMTSENLPCMSSLQANKLSKQTRMEASSKFSYFTFWCSKFLSIFMLTLGSLWSKLVPNSYIVSNTVGIVKSGLVRIWVILVSSPLASWEGMFMNCPPRYQIGIPKRDSMLSPFSQWARICQL